MGWPRSRASLTKRIAAAAVESSTPQRWLTRRTSLRVGFIHTGMFLACLVPHFSFPPP